MARCLGVLLALALLLCGCAQETTPPTAPTEDAAQSAVSTPTGLYVPESTLEQATGGAIRVFQAGDGCYGCFVLGEDLVLMRETDGAGELSLYRGEDLAAVRTLSLGQGVAPAMAGMQIGTQGIGYFDSADKAMVFLNTDFVEIGRMHLPEEMTGNAWLAPNWQAVYYCTQTGIYVMDLQTGISRLLRGQNAVSQEITGIFGAGEVLRYAVETTQGQQIQLIDTSTGMVLQEGAHFADLQTGEEQYFLPQDIRGVLHLRFGTQQTHQVLWPMEEGAEPAVLFENNAVVTVLQEETGTALAYYDLATGKRTAAISLPDVTAVESLAGDGEKGVWFLAQQEDGTKALLYWNSEKSAAADENIYTAPLYSREFPDEEGLAKVAQSAADLGSKFGVEILIWKDAAATAPADQFFTEEYITQVYEMYLTRLEQALAIFPTECFTKNSGEKLRIALVQQIAGEPAWGTLAQTDCLQFWNGNIPVVALTMDENFEKNICHGVYLYMETRILSKTSALYEWNTMNPAGFAYDNNYVTNLERTDTTYIEGENRYFIDQFSMSYAKEDRAQIFEYACQPGNEEYFTSPVIQKKLQRICNGIREAYGLKNVDTVFPWEQYLA